MDLISWARKHNISNEAIEELRGSLGLLNRTTDYTESDNHTEAQLLSVLRLEGAKKGIRLWRNNVGAAITKDGSFIRFGLANDSEKLNQVLKSSDLIGIKPVMITEDMVGKTIGQFVAIEVKKAGWNYTATKRECAQLRFLNLILSLGGFSCFATSPNIL